MKRVWEADPGILDTLGRGPYWDGHCRALHYAVYRDHRKVVRWLLERGASAPPLPRDSDWAPLHFAAFAANRAIVRLLIRHGATIDIFAAAALGNAAAVRRMLRKDATLVAARGPDGATPLHFAATPEVARLLMAAGADPEARDTFHRGTPLEWAVDRPHVRTLLADVAGANIDIHLACAIGGLRRVRELVRADPDALGRRAGEHEMAIALPGETPLGIAARYGRRQVVAFLIERGATTATDPSPLPDAVERGDLVIVRRLLDAGADPNAYCPHGHAALHLAARDGNLAVIRLLLAKGARLDLPDKEHGATPLGWAEYHRQTRALALLKSMGGG